MAVTSPTETGNTEGESGLGRKMANSRVEFEVSLEHRCLAVALTAPGEVGVLGQRGGAGLLESHCPGLNPGWPSYLESWVTVGNLLYGSLLPFPWVNMMGLEPFS